MRNQENTVNAVSEEMIQYATEVCGKYSTIKTLAEEAEASWKQNIEMAETSKYPAERAMYVQQAGENLAKYSAAREWMKIVMKAVFNIEQSKAREVVRQHCIERIPLKSVEFESGRCMGKTAVYYHKKAGLQQLAGLLNQEKDRMQKLEKKVREN